MLRVPENMLMNFFVVDLCQDDSQKPAIENSLRRLVPQCVHNGIKKHLPHWQVRISNQFLFTPSIQIGHFGMSYDQKVDALVFEALISFQIAQFWQKLNVTLNQELVDLRP
jgi:hypothetical protein